MKDLVHVVAKIEWVPWFHGPVHFCFLALVLKDSSVKVKNSSVKLKMIFHMSGFI